MPYLFARAAAFPGVGDATATTSASSEAILNEAAWMSASNCEPMIPTFTFPLLGITFNPHFEDRSIPGSHQYFGKKIPTGPPENSKKRVPDRKLPEVSPHWEKPQLSSPAGRTHLRRRRSKSETSRSPHLIVSTGLLPRVGLVAHQPQIASSEEKSAPGILGPRHLPEASPQ